MIYVKFGKLISESGINKNQFVHEKRIFVLIFQWWLHVLNNLILVKNLIIKMNKIKIPKIFKVARKWIIQKFIKIKK